MCVPSAATREPTAYRRETAKWAQTYWAPNGSAGIPTAALDPPHSAASPAVPALIGFGPHHTIRPCEH
jgi:hypothetical protein